MQFALAASLDWTVIGHRAQYIVQTIAFLISARDILTRAHLQTDDIRICVEGHLGLQHRLSVPPSQAIRSGEEVASYFQLDNRADSYE